jgi:T cell receptor alpha chain V region
MTPAISVTKIHVRALFSIDTELCIFFLPGKTSGESVTQKGGEMIVSEGAFLTINCTYTTAGFPYLFWYVQYPREGPQLLFRVTKSGEKSSHVGFEATYNRENTSFHLKKASVHESDSAVFYCALSDTVAETTGLSTN